MFGILLKMVDEFSYLILGIKEDEKNVEPISERDVKYTITSVSPSRTTMLEAQKYL